MNSPCPQAISLIDEFFKYISLGGNNAAVQCLMALRSLRPFRILTRFPRLRFLGATALGAFGMILRAALFSMVVLFSFGTAF